MRTVSFSHEEVQNVLNNHFVCSYTNTEGDPSAGSSFAHSPDDAPGPCGRGAGRQNVQTLFMTPAGEIFHVASGYLEPRDLLDEANFARQLFADLRRSGKRGREVVVAAHRQRLNRLGFSNQEIAAPENQFADLLLSGPNPQDFGIQMPKPQDFGMNIGGPAGDLFGDVARQRILKDHRFVMAHPLIPRQAFESNPQPLVGRQHSFFGSHSAMNGFNQQISQGLNRQSGGASGRRR